MANPENKQIPYESTQQDIRDAIESVATAIGGIAIPSADHVSYDNSGSGLSATDVQNALDEIVSDIPTVNNGTLTIQQNGTSIGSFSANTASNVTANIKTPTADKKTATDQFSTANGGLLSKCQINLVPVQSGSGDPSPDNVRPISGHTEVDLKVDGKNFVDSSHGVLRQYSADPLALRWGYEPITLDVGTYTVSYTKNSSYVLYLVYTDTWESIEVSQNGTTFTLTGKREIFLRSALSSGNPESSFLDLFSNVQLESGTSKTTFEPYLGHLYQVQIGSTVYGGYVDLVSGVMNVDRVGQKLQDFVWEYTSAYGGYFSSNQTYVMDDTIPLVSSCYQYGGKNSSNAQMVNLPDFSVIHRSNALPIYNRLRIKDSRYTTSEDLMSAVGNEVVVYALATPFTIQLTPQQIETLAGQNNLSTPLSGQSIETNGVEYKELFTFADVKEYVDKKIPDAPTTDGTYTLQAVVSGGVPTYSWV